MSVTPLVSIITVNFNHTHHTCALLVSLRKISYPNIEIIVVDNHSEESPEKIIHEQFPEVILIISQENLGFAGGNNLGIAKAKGKYLLFINNDTEVDCSFLEPFINLFENNPKAGIASPKILYYNSENTIQYAGCYRINPYTGRNKRIGYKEKDLGQHDTLRQTDLAHGAAMMVPKSVIDEVGMMPEIFFLYYEELDWCEAIKSHGYLTYVVPASRVYHKESMSVGKNSTLKTYYMTRNRLLFMRRNTKGITKLSWIIFFLVFSIPKNSIKYILNRDIEHLKAFWKGFIWNVMHLSNGERLKLIA